MMGLFRPSSSVVPRLPRRNQVTLWDRSAVPRALPLSWWLGSLVDGSHSYGKSTSEKAYDALYDHRATKAPIHGASIWCHGSYGKLHWGKKRLNMDVLVHALGPDLHWLWLRTCNFGRDTAEMQDLADRLKCDVYAHTEVVSAPDPRYQEGVVGTSPGCRPAWPLDAPDSPRANILQMRPDKAWLDCQPRPPRGV